MLTMLIFAGKYASMVYLLLAITASTLILVSFKVFEKLGIDSFTAITMNYLIGTVFGLNYEILRLMEKSIDICSSIEIGDRYLVPIYWMCYSALRCNVWLELLGKKVAMEMVLDVRTQALNQFIEFINENNEDKCLDNEEKNGC